MTCGDHIATVMPCTFLLTLSQGRRAGRSMGREKTRSSASRRRRNICSARPFRLPSNVRTKAWYGYKIMLHSWFMKQPHDVTFRIIRSHRKWLGLGSTFKVLCKLANILLTCLRNSIQIQSKPTKRRMVMKDKSLQGCSRRWVPGCVKMRWKRCVLLPAVGKRTPTFVTQSLPVSAESGNTQIWHVSVKVQLYIIHFSSASSVAALAKSSRLKGFIIVVVRRFESPYFPPPQIEPIKCHIDANLLHFHLFLG